MTDDADTSQSSGLGVQRGVQVATIAYLTWGFLTIYWKQLAAFEAFELIAWRVVCAAVVMSIVVTFRQSWPNVTRAIRDAPTLRRLALAGGLLLVNWTSYVWAVTNDRVIETALGYFISPLVTMAIGVFVLRETPTNGQRFAFASASIAVVILTVSYGRPPWVAFLIAGSWGFYGLTKRRVPLGAIDSLTSELLVVVVPALVAVAAFSLRADSIVQSADARDWAFVAGTGIATAVPLTLFAAAAQSIPFTLLGPLNLLVPVINFGLGWLLYGEPMPLDRLVGFAFVWLALLVVMGDRIAAHRRAPKVVPLA